MGVNTLPTLLVLDRNGKIVYRAGGIDPDEFPRELIAAIQGALGSAN
jgi:L-asparaginase II